MADTADIMSCLEQGGFLCRVKTEAQQCGGRFITHTHARTQVRLNTLSFSVWVLSVFQVCLLFFLLDMSSWATKCHCVVYRGLKSPLHTHTHTPLSKARDVVRGY